MAPHRKSLKPSDAFFDFQNNRSADRDDAATRAEKAKLIRDFLEKRKMTAKMIWTDPMIERLTLLNETKSLVEMAVTFQCSAETIRTKLHELGVKPNMAPVKKGLYEGRLAKPRENYNGGFQDVTADEARQVVRTAPPTGKVRRGVRGSLTGNAAVLCCG